MTLHTQRLDYLPALTGLRGIAACAVTIFHLWRFASEPVLVVLGYPLHALAACGFLGVDLFFVLSAFLLSQPFLAAAAERRTWPRLSTYFVRRALRVVPAFWTQVALLFVIGWVATGAPPFGARTALAHMLFVQHLIAQPGTINPVYWSLPVEWWFYFCIPFIARMFRWARWWLLLLLFLVLAFGFRLLCWQWLNEGQTDPWNNYGAIMFLRARIDQFFFGVLAAWAHLHLARDSRMRSLAAGLGALALFALLPSIAARGDFFVHADFPWILIHYAVSGSALALIVFGAAGAGRWAQALLANRVAAWLGALSYSLYLWHFPVLQWTQALGLWEKVPRALLVPVAAIGMLALAWLSYRLIERRFMHD